MLKSVAFVVLLSLSVEGATVFRVRMESVEGDGQRVRIAGDDICIEAAREVVARTYDVLTSSDGGKTFIAINHDNQTWYPYDQESPLTINIDRWCLGPEGKIRKVQWSFTSPASDHYVGKLSYVLRQSMLGERVDITCGAMIDIRTRGDLPRALWPSRTFVATRLPEIDERLARDLATVAGFPIRIAVTSTRRFEGGPPFQDEVVYVVEDLRETADAAAPACRRPSGYRQQAPIFGIPGR